MNTVSAKDSGYAQYEQLLLYRDRLKKDCRRISEEYMRVFGPLTVQVFGTRISCIRKRKMIRYIQSSLRLSHEPNLKELTCILQTEMEAYEKKLEKLNGECRACREYREEDALEAQKSELLYRELARLMHPDIHPETGTDPVLRDLWRRAEAAYDGNDADTLQELKDLAAGRIARAVGGPDVPEAYPDESLTAQDKKTGAQDVRTAAQRSIMLEAEIRLLLTSEPYTCQSILEDEALTEKKLTELREELVSSRLYLAELDAQLKELAAQGSA